MVGSRCTVAVVMAVALVGWSCGSTAPSATPQVAEVLVSPSTSTLAPNAQLPLRAQVQDGSGDIVLDAEVTWTVQDPAIVSVSPAGVVTALAVGTSQVAASSLGKSGLAVVTVKAESSDPGTVDPGTVDPGTSDSGNAGTNAVASVRVTAPAKKIKPGSTMQLTAAAIDANGNTVTDQTFLWSSSNTTTANVSESGVVSAKRPGKATINAQTGGKSGSVEIEVK